MIQRIHARLVAFLLCLLLAPALALAWGQDGHRIVGRIAEDRLSVNAKREIRKLIGDESISDDSVANWADKIKSTRTNTKPWHYVDIPVGEKSYDAKRDGHDGDNIIDKLVFFVGVLNDKSKTTAERAEALRFVVHFVGDMHQPLHCSDRNDKGGNSRTVVFLGYKKPSNLHSVWDTELVKEAMSNREPMAYADELAGRITPQQASEWGKYDSKDFAAVVINWANAAHELSRTNVYSYKDGGKTIDIPAEGPAVKLDVPYIEQAKPIVEEQLMKAGVRLANILNEAFP